MAIVNVPRPLREKLGEEASDALVELINKASGEVSDNVVEVCTERFEKRVAVAEERFEKRLAQEIGKLQAEFGELRGEFRALEERFEKKLAENKAELVRWMFLFWTGQIAVLTGVLTAILFAFFR